MRRPPQQSCKIRSVVGYAQQVHRMTTQDGSQYDFKPIWDQDRMLFDLEYILTALDAAQDDAERLLLRERAISLNRDLTKLHGIDLSPF